MKNKFLGLFSWGVLAFLPVAAMAAPAGQVVQSSGNVTLSAPNAPPKSAAIGAGVDNGQIVTTGASGKAVIKFQDGQVVALQSNSVFRIDSYKFEQAAPEKGEAFFSLLQGGLRAITGLIGDRNRGGWKLAMPTATIGIRGTDFLGVIQQGLYTQVNTGSIALSNSAGTAVFTAGESAFVATGTTLGVSVPATSLPAGIFTELQAINLGAVVGGSATGAGAAAGGTVLGVPTGVAVGLGVGAAAAAAAGGGDGGSTTTHSTTGH